MDDGISSDRPTITQSNTVDLVIDRPNPERAVSRALGGIQLFVSSALSQGNEETMGILTCY